MKRKNRLSRNSRRIVVTLTCLILAVVGVGGFEVKRDNVPWHQDIWYRDNTDGTILVYVYSESG